MANAKLDTREARDRLKIQGKPHFRKIRDGLHLGFRRLRGKPGTWCARMYDEQKRAYTIEGLGTETELTFDVAQDAARAKFEQASGISARDTGPVTVGNIIDGYLAARERAGRDTSDARTRANALILPVLGEVEITKLKTKKIEDWLDALATARRRVRTKAGGEQKFRDLDDSDEGKRRRRSSANRTWTILKAALNWGFSKGKIASDAAWRNVKSFGSVDAARLRYLTIEESKRLINAVDPPFRPLVQAALLTGARYGQITRLRASDFNPDSGTLRLSTKKGNGELRTYHATLTDEGREFFAERCMGRTGDTLLFPNGDREWQKSEQGRPMREACDAAKIEPPVGFHGLRHTWASHAVMNGLPLLIVAKNLGHTDTRMVERHYGHLADDHVAKLIREHAPRFGIERDNAVVQLRT
jgi:integrase